MNKKIFEIKNKENKTNSTNKNIVSQHYDMARDMLKYLDTLEKIIIPTNKYYFDNLLYNIDNLLQDLIGIRSPIEDKSYYKYYKETLDNVKCSVDNIYKVSKNKKVVKENDILPFLDSLYYDLTVLLTYSKMYKFSIFELKVNKPSKDKMKLFNMDIHPYYTEVLSLYRELEVLIAELDEVEPSPEAINYFFQKTIKGIINATKLVLIELKNYKPTIFKNIDFNISYFIINNVESVISLLEDISLALIMNIASFTLYIDTQTIVDLHHLYYCLVTLLSETLNDKHCKKNALEVNETYNEFLILASICLASKKIKNKLLDVEQEIENNSFLMNRNIRIV